MTQDEQHFINELHYCLEKADIVKAVALLQFFDSLTVSSQKKVLFEILKTPDNVAYPMLERLSRVKIDDPMIQEKITGLILEKSYGNDALIIEYIKKSDNKNKLLYIQIAGDLKIKAAVPVLEDILVNEKSTKILKEAIATIGKTGVQSAASAIASFLYGSNEKLRPVAIQALKELGGHAAIKKLYGALTGESPTDLLIIKAFADLQDQLSLEKLTDLLSSQFVDLRNAAIDSLIKIGTKAIPVVAENLKTEDADTLIHTLNVLGNIGDVTALPAIQKVIYNEPDDPNVRYAVYEAMERLPSTKSAISLAQGLCDPNEQVRMAAAKAIDKNLSTVLVAGMKNMVDARDENSAGIVATLIDAGADNAFNFLLDSDVFQEYAFQHLTQSAHPDVCANCIQMLTKKRKTGLVNKINAALKPETTTDKLHVVAVDDSKMMLKIYMRKLHEMGHKTDTFEFPAEAVKAIKKLKPDLLITDLNMPEMNGIQMTQLIRQTYTSKQLPIIMITTQSDVAGQAVAGVEDLSSNAITKAGVDIILNKPFEDIELKTAIEQLVSP